MTAKQKNRFFYLRKGVLFSFLIPALFLSAFFAGKANKLKHNHSNHTEKVFSEIYRLRLWGKDEKGRGTSGSGSTLAEGLPFVHYVQNFLDTYPIQSIVDIGCGDWVLAKEINWGNRDYLGIDVVKSVVQKNQTLYSKQNIRFLQLDAAEEQPLPSGDLLICKDVLQHLPNKQVFSILEKSKKFKYCLFINDIDPVGNNPPHQDINCGEYRLLDLTRFPFNVQAIAVSSYFSGANKKQLVLVQNF